MGRYDAYTILERSTEYAISPALPPVIMELVTQRVRTTTQF